MTTILAFLFVLGVLVFVHELGHFVAARRIGVRVLTFSLGFGPKLVSTRRGDTEYAISAIPLGGYVKMAGESVDDPRSGAPDEFLSKTKWQRFQVLIMGPVMNIMLAVIVMAVVLAQGAEVPAWHDQPPVIGTVKAGSPAEKAGLRRGDRVLAIADTKVDTWDKFNLEIGTRPNREVELSYLRDGRTESTSLRSSAEGKYEIGDIGVLPDATPMVTSLIKGDVAEKAGLKPGDLMLAVNGEPMLQPTQLREAISRNAGKETDILVRRNGQEQHITVTPARRGDGGMIGIFFGEQMKSFTPGPFEALKLSVAKNIEFGGLIFKTLGGLFVGTTSPRQLMGPVAIAQLSGESAAAGWIPLLTLMASISLNLGLLNLMPIPVLDGGHITIMALEGIARRDFSVQVKEKMLLAGFVLILLLMVTVIYNDLTRISWIERLMPWRN
ncbi:MAG TPA: RIP metalloprotease RseP [Vicinamibacterales bacterium]|nr:RIP metalloprotease RseP [Vicinamibacterales bacterium]